MRSDGATTPKIIKPLAAVGAAACTLALAGILIFALNAKKEPRRDLPLADVTTLAPGRVMVVDSDSFRYFVIRPLVGDVHVVAAPVDEGKVRLPEVFWWKSSMNCNNFGLDTDNGVITSASRFRCRDANQPAEWQPRWQWDINGRHVPHTDGQRIDNMYRVRVERDGDELTFVGLDTD